MDKPKLRVLHTEASLGWGGQEIRILDEASGLRRRGYDVRVAAPAQAEITAAAARYGVPVHPLPIDRRGLRALGALLHLLAEFKPDVVVTHSSGDSWLVVLGTRLSPVRPAIVRMRHLSTPVGRGPLNRWLYGRAVDRLVATGEATRRTLIEQLRLDPERVFSIPTGTDLSRFGPGDRVAARARLGLGTSGPIIGIVATLRIWKGHRFLFSALTDRRLAAARLVVVGDGPHERLLRMQARKAGVGKRVVFTGRQQDVAPWLHAFDVFALPSTGHENAPQAIQQALACGIPVVTTPVGAGLELIRDGENGLVVPVGDVPALTNAIVQLLHDPALSERLAAAGREHIAAQFTAAAMLDAMETVLWQAVRSRTGR